MLGLTTITTIFGYYNTFNNQLLQFDRAAQQRQQTSLSISGMMFGSSPATVANSAAILSSYIPITLTNSQTSATPTTFQQKITFNPSTYSIYEAANLGNIRFCLDSGCVTQLYAWLESCTPTCTTGATSASTWVKLTSSIGANGGTLTIYMVFELTSTNFDDNYWGEAPYLSGTYGQYDNGANVFTFYDNFAGTTLNAKWTQIKSASGITIAVNNGLTVTTTTTTAYGFVRSALQTHPLVAETYTTAGDSILGVSTTATLNNFKAPYYGYSLNWYSGNDYVTYQGSGAGFTNLNTIAQAAFPSGIWQVIWSATSIQYFVDGAGNTYSATNTGHAIANYEIYIGQSNGVIASSVFSWARMRAYPPNNVMPTTSLGARMPGSTSTGSSYSFERKLVYSQGLWWVFFSDGANIGYSTSPDGSTWSSEVTITSSTDSTYGFNFNIWVNGNTIYYVLGAVEQTSSFHWRYGTLQSSGAIIWTIPETSVSTTNKVDSYNSIITDSSGNVWVAFNTNDGTNAHLEVWKYSAGSWAKQDDISPLASDIVPILAPLANGVALIYGEGSITSVIRIITTTTGASWTAAVSPTSDYALFSSSATSIGNTLYFAGLASGSAGQTSGTVNFCSFAYGSGSTSSERILAGSSAAWIVSISEDPSDTLMVFYGSGTTLSLVSSTNYGGYWSTAQTLSSSESSITGVSSAYVGGGVMWTSGSSSPFNIRFAAVPLITTINNSPFSIHLISLYVYNTQSQSLLHYDTNSSGSRVSGTFDYEILPSEQLSIPLPSFTWTTTTTYLITITTDQGVLESDILTSPS